MICCVFKPSLELEEADTSQGGILWPLQTAALFTLATHMPSAVGESNSCVQGNYKELTMEAFEILREAVDKQPEA
jgi:hypothetical protein